MIKMEPPLKSGLTVHLYGTQEEGHLWIWQTKPETLFGLDLGRVAR